jgi:hypothetical protein
MKREKKQSGCKEVRASVNIEVERTGNLIFKSLRAVPSHHSGRYRPKSMQITGR